jgi:hypothetical protein
MARKYLGGSGERLTVWISIAASTVLIFYGYDQGVFGNVIINENFLNTFGHPSANMQGVMTSIYNIGCFIGAMSTIWSGDILGRPRQIMLGSTIHWYWSDYPDMQFGRGHYDGGQDCCWSGNWDEHSNSWCLAG